MKSKKVLIIGGILGFLALVLFTLYKTTGFFVIQPIGMVPDGATIWYWRSSLNMPFIASADWIAEEKMGKVSLLGRGLLLGEIAKLIGDKKIALFPYSERLYLISTNGVKYVN